jgi:hypothetical protein
VYTCTSPGTRSRIAASTLGAVGFWRDLEHAHMALPGGSGQHQLVAGFDSLERA